MFETLDFDTFAVCVQQMQKCGMRSVYSFACCSKVVLVQVKNFLTSIRRVNACQMENVAMLLRDAPYAKLMRVYTIVNGMRMDSHLYRILQNSGNGAAIEYIGFNNMTPAGFGTALEEGGLHLDVMVTRVPRWREFLSRDVVCNAISIDITIADLPPRRILTWMHMHSLQNLSLTCNDVNSAVSCLPSSLRVLTITSFRASAHVWALGHILMKLRLLDELRMYNCFMLNAYTCAFIDEAFDCDYVHLPRVIGMDPFPPAALRSAIRQGSRICARSSVFVNVQDEMEMTLQYGRKVFVD